MNRNAIVIRCDGIFHQEVNPGSKFEHRVHTLRFLDIDIVHLQKTNRKVLQMELQYRTPGMHSGGLRIAFLMLFCEASTLLCARALVSCPSLGHPKNC